MNQSLIFNTLMATSTMNKGTPVITKKLQSTTGIIANAEYLNNRRADMPGTIWGWLPGHGGDVWVIQHEHGDAVYFTEEFEPTANSHQPTANSQQPTANSQQPTANSQRDTITVYFDGLAMSVWRAVSEPLNLKNGQILLNEKHFWEVLRANASFGISICEHEISKNNN